MRFLTAITLIALIPFFSLAAQGKDPVFIVSPGPGEVIIGERVRASIHLPDQLGLRDPGVFGAHKEGEGHLHLWLDALGAHDQEVSITLSSKPEYTFEDVFSGLHTLYVEFVRNDHASYEPKVSASVDFETITEELIAVQEKNEKPPDSPKGGDGRITPRVRKITLGALALAGVLLIGVWYVYRRSSRRIRK